MTFATEMQGVLADLAPDFAATATYTSVQGATSDAGAVTETRTTRTLTLFGPVGEQKRSEATGATCLFYLPAPQAFTPRVGDRITQSSRVWLVNTIEPASVGPVPISWALTCGETKEPA